MFLRNDLNEDSPSDEDSQNEEGPRNQSVLDPSIATVSSRETSRDEHKSRQREFMKFADEWIGEVRK